MIAKKNKQSDLDLKETDILQEQRKEFAVVLERYGLFVPAERYKIICPFHEDINASLEINMEKASFFCYGCRKGGGVFNFVRYLYPNKSIS